MYTDTQIRVYTYALEFTCKRVSQTQNLVQVFENVILSARKFTAAAGHSDTQKSTLLVLAKDLYSFDWRNQEQMQPSEELNFLKV